MANDRIIGHPKEEEIRSFIYKCLIVDKLPKLKIKDAILKEFGLHIGATTVHNYYNLKMFWQEIKPHVAKIREAAIIELESGDLEGNKAEFCQETYDKVIDQYDTLHYPLFLIERVAESAAHLAGNAKAANEGRAVLKGELATIFTKLHKALQDAK